MIRVLKWAPEVYFRLLFLSAGAFLFFSLSCTLLPSDCEPSDASCSTGTAAVLLSTFLPTAAPSLTEITGLATYLPLDGDANDTAGNNLNGTVNNGSFTSDRLGRANMAYLVDHATTNQYLQLNNTSVDGFSDFTIAFWARLDSFHGADRNTFISASGVNSATGFELQLGYYSTDGRLQVNVANSSSFSYATNVPGDSQWHHYALSRAGGVGSLYLDGGLVLTGIFINNTALSANTFGLILGQELNTSGTDNSGGGLVAARTISGPIDDFRVYNRALTSLEVTGLFEQTPP